MEERYPIGETDSVAVAVLRHEQREAGYPRWSASIGLRGGEATVSVPGHYPGVLAQRLRAAHERFAPGARLGRDEYLDVTEESAMPDPPSDESLWSRSRDFDWGD